jgi:hypothetical protein
MNDLNSKNNRKNKIASIVSLAVGISGLVLIVLFYSIEHLFLTWIVSEVFPYTLLLLGAVLIFGIISGKEGEKSTLEGVAIAGRVICTICLIIWVLFSGFLILSIFWSRT